MQSESSCHLLSIYIDENDRWHHQPLYLAILDMLKNEGIEGATVLRGIAGYGMHRRIHTARLVEIVDPLPLVIEVIDQDERLARILPKLQEMVPEGLIIQQPVQVIKRSSPAR